MCTGIYAKGRGFSRDKADIAKHVDKFAQRILADKTFEQLQLIEALPQLHVTPALLKRCGLITDLAGKQRAVIYIKFVRGSPAQLRSMQNSPNEDTAKLANKFDSFLRQPIPVHLANLGLPMPDANNPFFFHIGRYCNGVQERRHGEALSISSFDAVKGGRSWVETMVHGGGQTEIDYYPLAVHDGKCGRDWSDHMVSFSLHVCANEMFELRLIGMG